MSTMGTLGAVTQKAECRSPRRPKNFPAGREGETRAPRSEEARRLAYEAIPKPSARVRKNATSAGTTRRFVPRSRNEEPLQHAIAGIALRERAFDRRMTIPTRCSFPRRSGGGHGSVFIPRRFRCSHAPASQRRGDGSVRASREPRNRFHFIHRFRVSGSS